MLNDRDSTSTLPNVTTALRRVVRRMPGYRLLANFIHLRRDTARELRSLGLRPWKRNVVFDVGANNGSNFTTAASVFPWMAIYAFEPTPRLVDDLTRRMKPFANYHVVPKAVGENEGTALFNVAGQSDWGCSSFLEFSDNLEKTWPGRVDFKVTEQIEVPVIRLDTFVRTHGIKRIDFLHVDTQGTDVAVMRSLGQELSRVRAGVIEVPQSDEVMLYKGQHTRREAFEFLESRGFRVWKVSHQMNEDNLYFCR